MTANVPLQMTWPAIYHKCIYSTRMYSAALLRTKFMSARVIYCGICICTRSSEGFSNVQNFCSTNVNAAEVTLAIIREKIYQSLKNSVKNQSKKKLRQAAVPPETT